MGRPTDSPKISRVTARIDIDTKKYLINTVKNTISIKQKQSAAQFWNCWKTYNRAWRSSTQSKRICRFPPVRSPRRRKHIKTCFPFSSTYLLKKWKEAAPSRERISRFPSRQLSKRQLQRKYYTTYINAPCEKWRCRSAKGIFPMLPSFKAWNFAIRLKLFYHMQSFKQTIARNKTLCYNAKEIKFSYAIR